MSFKIQHGHMTPPYLHDTEWPTASEQMWSHQRPFESNYTANYRPRENISAYAPYENIGAYVPHESYASNTSPRQRPSDYVPNADQSQMHTKGKSNLLEKPKKRSANAKATARAVKEETDYDRALKRAQATA